MKFQIVQEYDFMTKRTDDHFMLEFEKQVNSFLSKKYYGEDIECFLHVFRVNISGSFFEPARYFYRKNKELAISTEMEPAKFRSLDSVTAMPALAESLLEAISIIETLRQKPKKFDRIKFKNDLISFFNKKGWIN